MTQQILEPPEIPAEPPYEILEAPEKNIGLRENILALQKFLTNVNKLLDYVVEVEMNGKFSFVFCSKYRRYVVS